MKVEYKNVVAGHFFPKDVYISLTREEITSLLDGKEISLITDESIKTTITIKKEKG